MERSKKMNKLLCKGPVTLMSIISVSKLLIKVKYLVNLLALQHVNT